MEAPWTADTGGADRAELVVAGAGYSWWHDCRVAEFLLDILFRVLTDAAARALTCRMSVITGFIAKGWPSMSWC
ncbi:hypothetical protein BCD48_26230 [Pseudofrankia sp. BMG5.36]|nr:hypothetical protein BCD48_26230 [Pseudofrankia sp. BMG5.36]